MNDLISIIIPVYNVEKYLDKCIDSVVNQTYTNLEIILVNDGSTDNSPEICNVWADKDNRIKVINKENGGLSDARNTGLAAANGVFIAFVDSDDYLVPDMYEKLINTIYQTESDIALCKFRYVYETEQYSLCSADSYDITEYTAFNAMSALIDDRIRQVVWNKLYRSEIAKDIMFDVGKFHEDEFWSYKAIGNASKIAEIDYTGYNYLQRANSIMNNDYSLRRLDALEAKCLRQTYLDSEYPELSDKGRINLIFFAIYNGQMALKHLNKSEKKAAFDQLKNCVSENIKSLNINKLPAKQKIWFTLAKASLKACCTLRNMLKIGF